MQAVSHDQPRRSESERRHQPPIVCGVDGSVDARAAARLASALAERSERRLVLVQAVTVGVRPLHVATDFDDLRRHELDAARRLQQELRGELGAPQLETEIRCGSPAQAIVETAAGRNAGLIVVGSHEADVVRAAMAGAVTDAVPGTVACPVVVVPTTVAETGAAPLTGGAVLCGVQRPEDLMCARVAHGLARALGCRLVLAHVLPRRADAAALTPTGMARATLARRGVTREQAAVAALRRVRNALPGDIATDLRVRNGGTVRQLADLAVEEDAILVVVGSRRWRGRLRATLLRSVSRRLAGRCRRPVVLCPSAPPS